MDSVILPGAKRLGMSLGEAVEIPEGTLGRKRSRVDSSGSPQPNSKRAKMTNLRLLTGSCYEPKADPEKPLGQDAYFIRSQTIGVADGVGGYAKDGTDSGVYARELMDNAYMFLQRESGGQVDPAAVLDYAYDTSTASGASTACIIALADDTLHAVNLGDSGFLVIRDEEVVYRSPIQQSGFNCPYQLGFLSRRNPSHAQEIVLEKVDSGDIIVAATDGLFDNLFDAQIEDIVNSSMREKQHPDVIARNLVLEARAVSLSREGVTPWTVAAVDAGRDEKKYLGGKYDDITVIVACIF